MHVCLDFYEEILVFWTGGLKSLMGGWGLKSLIGGGWWGLKGGGVGGRGLRKCVFRGVDEVAL